MKKIIMTMGLILLTSNALADATDGTFTDSTTGTVVEGRLVSFDNYTGPGKDFRNGTVVGQNESTKAVSFIVNQFVGGFINGVNTKYVQPGISKAGNHGSNTPSVPSVNWGQMGYNVGAMRSSSGAPVPFN